MFTNQQLANVVESCQVTTIRRGSKEGPKEYLMVRKVASRVGDIERLEEFHARVKIGTLRKTIKHRAKQDVEIWVYRVTGRKAQQLLLKFWAYFSLGFQGLVRSKLRACELTNTLWVPKDLLAQLPEHTTGSRLDLFPKLFQLQSGLCAICRQGEVKLVTDHDHRQNKMRGLLCNPCNVGLGMFRDDPSLLASAIGYLKKPPTVRLDLSHDDVG